MKISEITPDLGLKELLDGKLSVQISDDESRIVSVYQQGERPNSDIPEEYVEILQNGPIRSRTIKFGFLEGTLALSICIKANDDGTVKLNRLKSIIEQIENLLLAIDQGLSDFFYSFNSDNIVTAPSVNLTSGYSTAVLNITWHTK